jgi:hypothetical protein
MASSPRVRLNVALTATSPRARQNLVDALRFLMMTTRYDPGCVECSVLEDGDGTVRYTEVWATELDMRRRVGAEPFTSLLGVVESAESAQVQFDFVSETRGLDYIAEVRNTPAGSNSPRR